MGEIRLGAYLLAGDPVWLAASLARYYPLLQHLVVVAPASRRGWTGHPIPVDECLAVVRALDVRGIHEVVWGEWRDPLPIRADTAQRQAGLAALGHRVDWILQIDNDELLPHPARLLELLAEADARGLDAVEWPMRVLFRRLRGGDFLEVCARSGAPRYDYPGPIAVRPGATLVEARRSAGTVLRPVVRGDAASLQLTRPAAPGEVRLPVLRPADAIVHNSWGRAPAAIRRKIRTWGHASRRSAAYFWLCWWPAPLIWPLLRDFHPFARGLWPRLRRTRGVAALLPPEP